MCRSAHAGLQQLHAHHQRPADQFPIALQRPLCPILILQESLFYQGAVVHDYALIMFRSCTLTFTAQLIGFSWRCSSSCALYLCCRLVISVTMTLLRMALTGVAVPFDPEFNAMLLHTALLITLPRPLCPQFSLQDSLVSRLYIPPHDAYSALICQILWPLSYRCSIACCIT